MFKCINSFPAQKGKGLIALSLIFSLYQPISAIAQKWENIGRTATPDEIRAWDIDVRPDFMGLPPGRGNAEHGAELFEQKCASCHGSFGESNAVFTPLTGGVTKADIEKGRVASLVLGSSQPQRTTLMKVATLSTIWDYINRAMPWNAPRTLTADEVYALTAYLLSVSEVVPPDFELSHDNIREVQKKMPNRNGMMTNHGLWQASGKPDTRNIACMKDCPTMANIHSALPDYALNQHGNLRTQNREYGAIRGQSTDQSAPPPKAIATTSSGVDENRAKALINQHSCTACHQPKSKLVGPAFVDIAKKYASQDGVITSLTKKVKEGGVGVWGQIPMPANAGAGNDEIDLMVRYILQYK